MFVFIKDKSVWRKKLRIPELSLTGGCKYKLEEDVPMSEIQLHEWRKMHCRTINASIYMQVSMGIYRNSLSGKNFL